MDGNDNTASAQKLGIHRASNPLPLGLFTASVSTHGQLDYGQPTFSHVRGGKRTKRKKLISHLHLLPRLGIREMLPQRLLYALILLRITSNYNYSKTVHKNICILYKFYGLK
jgi:hypothetical protein